jgi:hypothetical protein
VPEYVEDWVSGLLVGRAGQALIAGRLCGFWGRGVGCAIGFGSEGADRDDVDGGSYGGAGG